MLILTICLLAVKTVLTLPLGIESNLTTTTMLPPITTIININDNDTMPTTTIKEEIPLEKTTENIFKNEMIKPTVIMDHHEIDAKFALNSTENNKEKIIVKRSIIIPFDSDYNNENNTTPELKEIDEESKINCDDDNDDNGEIIAPMMGGEIVEAKIDVIEGNATQAIGEATAEDSEETTNENSEETKIEDNEETTNENIEEIKTENIQEPTTEKIDETDDIEEITTEKIDETGDIEETTTEDSEATKTESF